MTEARSVSISPPEMSMPRFFPMTDDNFRLYALAMRLVRAETPPALQPLPLVRLTLKCLDAKDETALLRLLPPRLAVAQRNHQPLPSFAGVLIFQYLSDSYQSNQEASPC